MSYGDMAEPNGGGSSEKGSSAPGGAGGNATAPPLRSTNSDNEDHVYHVRWVELGGVKYPIVTQNENGPCPLLAIINLLVLKGAIHLQDMGGIVTAEQLKSYVMDALLGAMPGDLPEASQLNYQQNFDDAASILPKLSTGIDVNVRFTGVRDFEFTAVCSLFDLLQIPLYHGWVVDPHNQAQCRAVGRLTYNQLAEKVINDRASPDKEKSWNAELCDHFLKDTSSQLTIAGINQLKDTMKDHELAVLFRNNHFITLTKHNGQLHQLVTDQGFLQMPSVVWETLSGVVGGGKFTDGDFRESPPQLTPEQQIETDAQIARQMQNEDAQAAATMSASRAHPASMRDRRSKSGLHHRSKRSWPRQNQPGHQGNLVLSGAPGGGDTSIPDDVRAGDDVQGQSRVPSPDGDHGRSHVSPTDNTSNSKKWLFWRT
ncbi:ubiquitin carboxyl-terminal hydrolase MINDY-2-like isoform X1 [Varroa jacobsoni]|uniref:ubiquitin carboxyl-terminal hydrolase MINDY-2-like isoform X1 n=2 Tax=Varroa jacobsoni TaxID=62625 RepID=UPI000BF59086|nr:ubiquitin carboxyl-terminal hydrolase MINDY-2-like isoform X1 [Varroa jacobsoni]